MRNRKVQQLSEMPLLLSPTDCARLLGITTQQFNKRRKAGDWPLPFNREGHARWHRDTVDAFLRGSADKVA